MNRWTWRAWDKSKKEMIAWDWFSGKDKFGLGRMEDLKEEDLIPIQFTGRTDSKDKEIFEGDILMARGEKGTVKWETDRFIVYSNALGMDVYYPLHSYSSDELVILGNVYTGEEQEILYGTTPNETA